VAGAPLRWIDLIVQSLHLRLVFGQTPDPTLGSEP
jgi:hypothetical protein